MATLDRVRARDTNWSAVQAQGASLRGAELDHGVVDGAVFDRASFADATVPRMRGYKTASWIGVDTREIDFTEGHLLRRFILDQNYLEEFRTQSRWAGYVYEVWRVTSDCGRSATRWAVCTLIAVCAFAWLYTLVGIEYGNYPTPISPLYYSVVTMTTLGYGEIHPSSIGGQIVAMCEVITGYVMLGGLLSILSNKMASRAT